MKSEETVFVGLSGGVDSSVAALRLIQAGKRVVGVFIKVWQPDFIQCDWEKERLDAMRVAAHLGIPFITFDAVDVYKNRVADYMIHEYSLGRTPNPDVMCNEHVKFGAFLEFALHSGADKVATGHYARTKRSDNAHHLLRGVDSEKDQSYFLWRLTNTQLSKIYFPVGDTVKSKIRNEARKAKIPTSEKHDSQGICFLGPVDMEDFLSHYIPRKEGPVLNTQGETIGAHTGSLFYTLGQRHGFTIHTTSTRSAAYYVIGKDLEKNTITVDVAPVTVPTDEILLSNVNRIGDIPDTHIEAQFRYRQKPFNITLHTTNTQTKVTVDTPGIDTPSKGQSCVFYKADRCLGGGIIE